MNITIKNLEKQLDGQPVLRTIDLVIPEHKVLGIIGPNGSGKSTLLRCICRVLQPDGGAVLLDGRSLREYSPRQTARRMATVAQHNTYNFDFTVQDIVLMGRSPHKRAFERDDTQDYRIVSQSLAQVGMDGFQHRSFSSLSGGERQRVILARALAQQTPCLLLDEPTNHLDIRYQLQLMELVRGLGRTVITAVHDLNIAAMYCDTLVVMQAGCIVASGTPQEILTPALIRQVYGVQARVLADENGVPYILFRPECGTISK
ncbi:ABC transporter ATP-binding protein [uncultured Gemmiger sp.]|uniref:ABC transporter ATP-binding protein n=1 Tax=uncultured Gemmiger sp. TaxID=1623490 RepID=UPI0025FA4E2E|nr:ABC transporter ATP-binding protein [uncultured Gemmiger sp.]